MYAHGRRHTSHKKLFFFLTLFVILVGGYALYLFFQADTKDFVNNGNVSITKVEDDRGKMTTFNQKNFLVELPADWQMYQKDESENGVRYFFKSTKKNNDGRNMIIYEDSNTSMYAVNKMIPVSANKNQLSLGQVSDTCANFVGTGNNINARADQKLPDTIAKWQNISFLCDLSNTNRNAVGTSSTEGVNKITLEGFESGQHTYFFMYTDHNKTPDYSIFTESLRSFKVK